MEHVKTVGNAVGSMRSKKAAVVASPALRRLLGLTRELVLDLGHLRYAAAKLSEAEISAAIEVLTAMKSRLEDGADEWSQP